MPRLLPGIARAMGGVEPAAGRGGEAARRDELDRECAYHAGSYAALLRRQRNARLQGGLAIPGGDGGRRAAAVLDAVPAIRARRPRTHDRGVHSEQLVRRVLRVDPVLSRQELSAAAAGERQRIFELSIASEASSFRIAPATAFARRSTPSAFQCSSSRKNASLPE